MIPFKSNAVLPTARHRSNFSKGAMLPRCNDREMGSTKPSHASGLEGEYNEERLCVKQC